MRSIARVLALFTTPMALVLVQAPFALARSTGQCTTPRHATVVLRTGKLAVFRRDVRLPAGEGTNSTWTACWRRMGRRTTLATFDSIGDTGTASFFRAAGSYVAFRTSGRDHYGARWDYLNLTNARTGRNYFVAAILFVPPFSELGNELLALRLNDHGFMGWKILLPSGSVIYAHDSRGSRRLDSTSGQFGPLGLVGNRLTWSLNGAQRSAVLV